jgi:hypothetical protein
MSNMKDEEFPYDLAELEASDEEYPDASNFLWGAQETPRVAYGGLQSSADNASQSAQMYQQLKTKIEGWNNGATARDCQLYCAAQAWAQQKGSAEWADFPAFVERQIEKAYEGYSKVLPRTVYYYDPQFTDLNKDGSSGVAHLPDWYPKGTYYVMARSLGSSFHLAFTYNNAVYDNPTEMVKAMRKNLDEIEPILKRQDPSVKLPRKYTEEGGEGSKRLRGWENFCVFFDTPTLKPGGTENFKTGFVLLQDFHPSLWRTHAGAQTAIRDHYAPLWEKNRHVVGPIVPHNFAYPRHDPQAYVRTAPPMETFSALQEVPIVDTSGRDSLFHTAVESNVKKMRYLSSVARNPVFQREPELLGAPLHSLMTIGFTLEKLITSMADTLNRKRGESRRTSSTKYQRISYDQARAMTGAQT